MTASTKISVIVPVFEDPVGMKSCLQGLVHQTLPADQFDVVVVDNGSSPPIALSGSALPNLGLVQCATPGSYAARNAGVRAARGTLLAFTDADCIPDADWLQSGIRALESAGREAIVGGEVQMPAGARPTAVALYQALVGFQQSQNIGSKGFSVTANLFCSRAVLDRTGPFAEGLLSGGDREWCWRAARMGVPTLYAPQAIVVTSPRSSLRGAVRQARRVVAGRRQLIRSGLAADRPDALAPHRGVFSQLLWIITHRELGWFDRLRVLVVAGIIKLASWLETIRIFLGGRAERR